MSNLNARLRSIVPRSNNSPHANEAGAEEDDPRNFREGIAWKNVLTLAVAVTVVVVLVVPLAGLPISSYFDDGQTWYTSAGSSYNVGGINSTGGPALM